MRGMVLLKSIHDLSVATFGVPRKLFISNSFKASGFSFTSPAPLSNCCNFSES